MRQLIEYAKMAMRNIVGNKMRSLLTMLGIIIGISAVITVLCVGSGGKATIEDQLSGISNGSVFIMIGGSDSTVSDYFTDDDIEAVSRMHGVAGVSMVGGASGTAHGTREDVAASINAGSPDMHLVMPSTIQAGRNWNESDYAAARRVCVVDSAGAKELFGSDNVVGMTIQLSIYGKTVDFIIIGVTESSQTNMGRNVTAQITMPMSTLAAVDPDLGAPYYQIALVAEDSTQSASVAQTVVSAIEMRHGNGGRDMYYIQDIGQYMEQISSVTDLFTNIIAAIAGISLLVGGIGVMNIMLVSVTERTREIGIRKALGAKTRTILFQFLIESATLTLVGGVIGIVLGMLGGTGLGSLMGIKATISPGLVVVIALFSSAIGIFFGIYPARKAARLNPIEALRSI